MALTIPELRQRLWEIDDQMRDFGKTSWPASARKDYQAQLERALGEQAARERAREQAERRTAMINTIAPAETIWRPFIRELVGHVADLMMKHRISYRWDGRRPRAHVSARILYGDFVTTEKAVSTVLHEMAHLVEPRADSYQQRHIFTDSGMASPLAEVEAWKWAVAHCWRGHWTAEMQEDLAAALHTYRGFATLEEKQLIIDTIAETAAKVVPAPDTLEGCERRVEQIQREEKLRRIELDTRYRRVMYGTR